MFIISKWNLISMKTEIIYSKLFNRHDNPNHPENAKRTDVMMDALFNSDLMDDVCIVEPPLLPEQQLYSVHNEFMIARVKAMSKFKDSWIDSDTYISKDDFSTARRAAGGMVQLCQDVLQGKTENGYALVRPPGHHATPSQSMGFCLFNNIALGAQHLIEQGKRVLIFDPDVHHGNGTQDIFYNSNKVLFQSFHLSPHFPGTGSIDEIGVDDGEGYTVNAPLPHKTGEITIQRLFDEVFKPIAEQFKPDIILVSTGYDSHFADRLGGLYLGINFFGEIIRQLQEIQKISKAGNKGIWFNKDKDPQGWMLKKTCLKQLLKLVPKEFQLGTSLHYDNVVEGGGFLTMDGDQIVEVKRASPNFGGSNVFAQALEEDNSGIQSIEEIDEEVPTKDLFN